MWLKKFERYVSVTDSSGRSDSDKINLLCYAMGEKSEEILVRLCRPSPRPPHLTELRRNLILIFFRRKTSFLSVINLTIECRNLGRASICL